MHAAVDEAGASADAAQPCQTLRGAAVFLVVVSLADERRKCIHDLLYWRRFIRACLPAGAAPVLALVGSRAEGRRDAQQLLEALRQEANDAVGDLPPVVKAFAIDCRSHSACAPLRRWLVEQHRRLTGQSVPVPRACEAILVRKKAWRSGKERCLVLSWDDFCRRCREEIGWLATADEELLRVAANFLHDSGEVVSVEHGVAARCVVLHPTWLCSLVCVLHTAYSTQHLGEL